MRTSRQTDLRQELRAAEMIGKAIVESLKDKEQFRRYIVTEKRGSDTCTEEYIFGKVDYKAVGELVRTVKALEELKRSAGGLEPERGGNLVVLPMVEEL